MLFKRMMKSFAFKIILVQNKNPTVEPQGTQRDGYFYLATLDRVSERRIPSWNA